MGKGDKKTKRGKIFQGSFGVRRRKNKDKKGPEPVVAPKAVKSKEKEVKEVKEVKEPAPAKAPKAAAAAKKEPKAKKQDTTSE